MFYSISLASSHRVDLLRPLSQVEIIPMPYVTETTKIYMILPVSVDEAEALKVFLDKFEKVSLSSCKNVIHELGILESSDEQRQGFNSPHYYFHLRRGGS